jgi:hypothetical protein
VGISILLMLGLPGKAVAVNRRCILFGLLRIMNANMHIWPNCHPAVFISRSACSPKRALWIMSRRFLRSSLVNFLETSTVLLLAICAKTRTISSIGDLNFFDIVDQKAGAIQDSFKKHRSNSGRIIDALACSCSW